MYFNLVWKFSFVLSTSFRFTVHFEGETCRKSCAIKNWENSQWWRFFWEKLAMCFTKNLHNMCFRKSQAVKKFVRIKFSDAFFVARFSTTRNFRWSSVSLLKISGAGHFLIVFFTGKLLLTFYGLYAVHFFCLLF